MGGQDDGAIVVWNIETKEPVCGSPAQHKSAGITYCLAASREDEYQFFSAGKYEYLFCEKVNPKFAQF